METFKNLSLHVCGCCKRTLPIEAFYLDKKTGCPGNYCKECRKSASRKHRNVEKHSSVNKDKTIYPVITRIKDPTVRKELIRRALETVYASIERKRRKLQEIEDNLDI